MANYKEYWRPDIDPIANIELCGISLSSTSSMLQRFSVEQNSATKSSQGLEVESKGLKENPLYTCPNK